MSAREDSSAVTLTQPYASVVVGTDFTPCSGVAVGQALRIAAWSGSPLHVVHVIDTAVVIEIESALSPLQQGIRDGLIREAERAWTEFAATIPGASGLPIEVCINNRIVGILRHAQTHKADLLVVGAFGDRRPDLGFGTVATACVRKSMTDVLLVRDTQTGPFKSVVVAVDFSETSARALARAALVAARDSAELHVLHVLGAPWHRVRYRSAEPIVAPDLQKRYLDTLEARLADCVLPIADAYKGLRLRTVCHDYRGHRSGIVEYARSVSADLIALGTRGRTNLRDMLLGSTAEKVLVESACSVLAVKPADACHPLASGEEPRLMGVQPNL